MHFTIAVSHSSATYFSTICFPEIFVEYNFQTVPIFGFKRKIVGNKVKG